MTRLYLLTTTLLVLVIGTTSFLFLENSVAGELDALIDLRAPEGAAHDLALRRLKKRRLVLRDAMDRLERDLQPPESA